MENDDNNNNKKRKRDEDEEQNRKLVERMEKHMKDEKILEKKASEDRQKCVKTLLEKHVQLTKLLSDVRDIMKESGIQSSPETEKDFKELERGIQRRKFLSDVGNLLMEASSSKGTTTTTTTTTPILTITTTTPRDSALEAETLEHKRLCEAVVERLSRIINKEALMKRYPGPHEADEIFTEYVRFLVLKSRAVHPDALSPSSDIDWLWHNHILDTANYATDCIKFCGFVIHHVPDAASDPVHQWLSRLQTTVEEYKRAFLSDPPESIWGSVPTMGPDEMRVLVTSSNRRSFYVRLPKQATVYDLKRAIEDCTDVPEKQQRVIVGSGTDLTEEDGRLWTFGIQNDSSITFSVAVAPPATIHVRVFDHDATVPFTVEVAKDGSVDDLKNAIGAVNGLHPKRQQLSRNDRQMTNGSDKLCEYGIVLDNCSVTLRHAQLHVRILPLIDGDLFSLEISSNSTVADLKAKLDGLKWTGLVRQHYLFRRMITQRHVNLAELDDNNAKLYCYGIEDDSLIVWSTSPVTHIIVDRPIGEPFTIPLPRNTPVEFLKAVIQVMTGIPIEQQRPRFAGQLLLDTKLLSDYGIRDKADVHMSLS